MTRVPTNHREHADRSPFMACAAEGISDHHDLDQERDDLS